MFLTALWIALILTFSLKYKIVVQNSFEDGATGEDEELIWAIWSSSTCSE